MFFNPFMVNEPFHPVMMNEPFHPFMMNEPFHPFMMNEPFHPFHPFIINPFYQYIHNGYNDFQTNFYNECDESQVNFIHNEMTQIADISYNTFEEHIPYIILETQKEEKKQGVYYLF